MNTKSRREELRQRIAGLKANLSLLEKELEECNIEADCFYKTAKNDDTRISYYWIHRVYCDNDETEYVNFDRIMFFNNPVPSHKELETRYELGINMELRYLEDLVEISSDEYEDSLNVVKAIDNIFQK